MVAFCLALKHRCKGITAAGRTLTEPVRVQRQTLELGEVSDGGRKDLYLVPGQIHRPQVGREPLQLLWKLKADRDQDRQLRTSGTGDLGRCLFCIG